MTGLDKLLKSDNEKDHTGANYKNRRTYYLKLTELILFQALRSLRLRRFYTIRLCLIKNKLNFLFSFNEVKFIKRTGW